MKIFLYIIVFFFSSLALAQTQETPVLSYERFMEIVEAEHPLSHAAELQTAKAEALLLKARGGFDPVLAGDYSQKDFNEKNYYNLLEGGLKIPTWLGLSGHAGYTQNDGQFLNPQAYTPNGGLISAGVSLSLGQGLFIDARRAQLKQAHIGLQLADTERRLLLNDLLLEAGTSYWNWFLAYHSASVYQEAKTLAEDRLNAVKQAALFGDRPYIDTLEASIQVQMRSFNLEQALLDLNNSAASLSVFLWSDGFLPLELEETTVPINLDEAGIAQVNLELLNRLDTLLEKHPYIQNANLNLETLEIERRLKAEQLKPRLDVKYNALTEDTGSDVIGGFNSQDYALGLQFSMPILLRKERGDLQLAKVKVKEGQLKLADTRQDTWLKARVAINEQNTTASQARLYERTVSDYRSLLNGEQQLFQAGESSLFLVNSREVGYVQTKVKWIELISKNRKAALKSAYTLSTLSEEL
jgi:outer membrane protein TolC